MANWVQNKLFVSGKRSELLRFKETVRSGAEDLYIEEPETVNAHVKHEKRVLEYSFESRWNMPEDWVMTISQDFLSLSFKLYYSEPLTCVFGAIEIEDGCLVNDIHVDYNNMWPMIDLLIANYVG